MAMYILGAIVLLAVLASAYFRFAPIDAEAYNLPPSQAIPPDTPNYALMAGTSGAYVQAEPRDVAARIAAIAEGDGARLLAGAPDAGLVTYVVRSRIMGFPDVVTVQILPDMGGVQVDLYSRAIYGYSDLGVNTVRARRWLDAARGIGGPEGES